jgi:hypothetical protein
MLGSFPVFDPQALRNPRRDNSYLQSGVTVDDSLAQGSRIIQWGWAPVGGARFFDVGLTPNYLVSIAQLGTVTAITA